MSIGGVGIFRARLPGYTERGRPAFLQIRVTAGTPGGPRDDQMPLMHRGIISLMALAFCAPDLFGEDGAAVVCAAPNREIQLKRQRTWAAGVVRAQPLEWFVVGAIRDGEDPAEVQPVRRARIAADWLEQSFFGQAESTVVRRELETNLAHEVEWLGET